MDPSTHQPPLTTTVLIYIVAIGIFVWRLARPQRMSVARLWFMPLFLLLLTGFSVWATALAASLRGATTSPAWEIALVMIVGAALGIPLGVLRGRHSEVKPTERRGVMYVHSSPLIIVIWLAAFVARAAVRYFIPSAQGSAAVWGDGLLAFAVAALIASYYAIFLKYRLIVGATPQRIL